MTRRLKEMFERRDASDRPNRVSAFLNNLDSNSAGKVVPKSEDSTGGVRLTPQETKTDYPFEPKCSGYRN